MKYKPGTAYFDKQIINKSFKKHYVIDMTGEAVYDVTHVCDEIF